MTLSLLNTPATGSVFSRAFRISDAVGRRQLVEKLDLGTGGFFDTLPCSRKFGRYDPEDSLSCSSLGGGQWQRALPESLKVSPSTGTKRHS
jgi:hypothetical protein